MCWLHSITTAGHRQLLLFSVHFQLLSTIELRFKKVYTGHKILLSGDANRKKSRLNHIQSNSGITTEQRISQENLNGMGMFDHIVW